VELAQARYEAGGMDFVQFQTVLRSAADAERQEADARLQLALAWVTLQQRLGTPVASTAGAP
jgi:outer membrane protein TolC